MIEVIGSLIISGSGVDSIGGLFYVFYALACSRWAGSGVGVMSDMKNKNYAFIASVFRSKLFSVIAATMLLLLVDGGINNSANV